MMDTQGAKPDEKMDTQAPQERKDRGYSPRLAYLPYVETLLEPIKIGEARFVKRAVLPSGSKYLVDEHGTFRSAKREAKRRSKDHGKADGGSDR